MRDFDLSLSECVEWRTPFHIPTYASLATQRPPPEPQTAEEKTAAMEYSAAMSKALDSRHFKNPLVGQRVKIISGPSKGLVGTLRDITSLDLWQVELDAKLTSSAALHMFQRNQVSILETP